MPTPFVPSEMSWVLPTELTPPRGPSPLLAARDALTFVEFVEQQALDVAAALAVPSHVLNATADSLHRFQQTHELSRFVK